MPVFVLKSSSTSAESQALATFNDDNVPLAAKELIQGVIEEHGFIFVELADLEQTYDGLIDDKVRIRTWFTRFFDYL